MVRLAGGSFRLGSDDRFAYPEDGEGPVREVELGPFWIDPCAVSNADFARFVDATGFTTEAEEYGWSFVFAGFLPDDFPPTRGVARAPWWRQVEGADRRHPDGPQSDLEGRITLSSTSRGTTGTPNAAASSRRRSRGGTSSSRPASTA